MYELMLDLSSPLRPSYHWGSVFHGLLMELLPEPWPTWLHENAPHTLSQWIEPKGGTDFQWHIKVLDDTLGEVLAESIAQAPEALRSRHLKTDFEVRDAACFHVSFDEVAGSSFQATKAPKWIRLDILTPATHKSDGLYVTLPTIPLIVRGLRNRVVSVWPDFALADDDLLNDLMRGLSVNRYRLQSAPFGVDGAYALGYIGSLTLHYHLSPEKARLMDALMRFAPWCGIGAKTSLGMGGCRIASEG